MKHILRACGTSDAIWYIWHLRFWLIFVQIYLHNVASGLDRHINLPLLLRGSLLSVLMCLIIIIWGIIMVVPKLDSSGYLCLFRDLVCELLLLDDPS